MIGRIVAVTSVVATAVWLGVDWEAEPLSALVISIATYIGFEFNALKNERKIKEENDKLLSERDELLKRSRQQSEQIKQYQSEKNQRIQGMIDGLGEQLKKKREMRERRHGQ